MWCKLCAEIADVISYHPICVCDFKSTIFDDKFFTNFTALVLDIS
jgi:hypothetical protein